MEPFLHPKPRVLEELSADEHAVIEASAGTGKTYTIEHLIVELLLEAEPEVTIDEILVVTYTRRATAELVQRVRGILGEIVDVARSDSTSQVDGRVADRGEPHWRIGEEELRRVKDAIYNFDRAPIYTIHGFCQRILTEYAFENRRLFDQEHVDDARIFDECFHDALRSEFSVDADCRPWLEAWLSIDESVESLREALYKEYSESSAIRPLYDGSRRREILEDLASGEADDNAVETAVIQILTPRVAERVDDRKRREGLYAFDDMLEMVWESMSGARGPELVEAIRDRFRFALIDEFQDTDPLQWKIFERLFYESDGRNVFYLIGDPKQAIYGFRGADVGTYLDAVDKVTGPDGEPERLERNYRSTPELIEAYNTLFDQEVDDPFFRGGEVTYADPVGCGKPELKLESGSGGRESAIEILELDAPAEASAKIQHLRYSFLEAIADEIEKLVEGDRRLTLEGEGESETIGPGDIFVLTDKKKRGVEMGEALRRRGVRHAFYRQDGLFQTPQALHIFKVLRAVAHPSDRSHRLHAYTTPFFEVGFEDLDRADDLEGSDAPQHLLREWNRIARRREFERLFERMLEESGLLRREIFFEESDRGLTNYRHIFELLTHEAHRSDRDVEELASLLREFVDGESEPEVEDANLQRLESDENAVQIMTVHKSKGLEAGVVFLYGGFGRRNAAVREFKEEDGDKVRYLVKDLMDSEQEKKGEAYFMRESERLMYVAITRAKAKVYLPYMSPEVGTKKRSSKLKGRYLPVCRRLDGVVADVPVGEPTPEFHRRRIGYRTDRVRTRGDDAGSGMHALELAEFVDRRPESGEAFAELRRRRRIEITSYSAMASGGVPGHRTDAFGADEATDARVDDTEPVDRWEEDELPPGRSTGLALHEILECVDGTTAARAESLEEWARLEEVADEIEAAMEGHGLSARYRSECERIAYRALTTPLEPVDGPALPPVSRADEVRNELTFYFPIPEHGHPGLDAFHDPEISVESGYVTGSIDLFFEVDGRVYLADWKSNWLETYGPEEVEASFLEHDYDLQATLYSLAAVRLCGVHGPAAYERFGGYFYVYLRGLGGDEAGAGLHFDRPDWEELEEFHRSFVDREGSR